MMRGDWDGPPPSSKKAKAGVKNNGPPKTPPGYSSHPSGPKHNGPSPAPAGTAQSGPTNNPIANFVGGAVNGLVDSFADTGFMIGRGIGLLARLSPWGDQVNGFVDGAEKQYHDTTRNIALSMGLDPDSAAYGAGKITGELASMAIPGGAALGAASKLSRLGRLADGAVDAAKAESRILSKVDNLPCNCFVKGTTVQTKNGPKAIQDIKIGDQVWAKNLTTGKSELRPVTGLFQKRSTTLMSITLARGATVMVTQEHPFMVEGQGWVLSGNLRVGDHLTQRDGGAATIAAIDVHPGGPTVYNFEVAGDHNYYITDAQLLVHNCDLGASIAGHIGSRRLADVHGSREAYIESVIHGDAPLAEMRSIGQSGRAIWREGRNLIIRDPSSAAGGTAFSKPSVEAAIRYYDEFK